jgi:hypothetical protein
MKVGDYVYIPLIGRKVKITDIDQMNKGVWVLLGEGSSCEGWYDFDKVELIPSSMVDPRVEAKV